MNNLCGAVPFGYQNDGAGKIYCAVANTEWGKIPGKAKDNKCWYSYGGKEYTTSDFSYLDAKLTSLEMVQNRGCTPQGALFAGKQSDGTGDHFAAIANTQWGKIPGKAKGKTCWYAYDGKENVTEDFMWLTTVRTNKASCGMNKLCGGVPFGFQNDGAGILYCAVANTEWGKIPGKAKGNKCWYCYGGKEYTTSDFSYLDAKFSSLEMVQNKGCQPQGALFAGKQSDGAGDHFAAIANTQWGKIPGKAKGKTCWYAYGGKENVTEDFIWVSTV